MHPSPRLPIDSCKAMFAKLQWDLQELEKGWDEYRTFNFVVTAHHLFNDWIDASGTKHQKRRRKVIPDEAKTIFWVWRDITNATKHWKLNADGRNKQVVTEVTEPIIADWHAYFITGPLVYISIGKAKPSLHQLANVTIRVLDWIINSEIESFPTDLQHDLDTVLESLGNG